MSQITRRSRVRLLAESVLLGRAVGGYANLIAARLRKLADEESTGMLPLSGHGDGAIYFRRGQVVYAESSRMPSPRRREAADPPLDRLMGMLTLAEPTIDAITDLVSNESRYAKFQSSDAPPVARTVPLSMEFVLAEVDRRRHLLQQLAAVVTADTGIARHAPRDSPRFQVSAAQWALLVRAGDGTTPRALALALGQSVFGTTIEVYRLLALGLLAVPGQPPELVSGPAARRPAEVMSFMRALSDEGGRDG